MFPKIQRCYAKSPDLVPSTTMVKQKETVSKNMKLSLFLFSKSKTYLLCEVFSKKQMLLKSGYCVMSPDFAPATTNTQK